MNDLRKQLSTCLLGIAALLVGASPAWAQTAPSLGTAANFAALGGAAVTCTSPDPAFTGVTVSGGDVGSLSSVTGFPPPTPALCSLSGTVHVADAVATAAFGSFLQAYATLDILPGNSSCPSADPTHNFAGSLDGLPPLSPGVYCIRGTGTLTGTLTLSGPANGIWIFKAASDLTPKGGTVVMAGGGSACNVYWKVGTAADFLNTDFVGNVLAGSAITFSSVGSSLVGRALAQTLVSLTGANITACTGGGTQPPPNPSCDKDHKHHKHCKHSEHDKPHCDGDDDGHGNGHGGDDDDDGHGSDNHHPFGSNDEHGRKGGDR